MSYKKAMRNLREAQEILAGSKMVTVGKLPRDIRSDLEKRGYDPEDKIPAKTAFEEWLGWNGLIGWGDDILRAVKALGL